MPTIPPPPKIPSGQEIYDAVMREIEPELISTSLPTLNEKYKDETPVEKEARKERYNKAFAEYYKRYTTRIAQLEEQVRCYRKEAMRSAEAVNTELEQKKLFALENSMSAT